MSGVLAQDNISVDFALVAAKAALEVSRARGYPRIAIAVANRAGQLVVLLKSDDGANSEPGVAFDPAGDWSVRSPKTL